MKKIEEFFIWICWLKVELNKLICFLIGWRGKLEYVYWDLYEWVYGLYVFVGGMIGLGKLEFLIIYLLGLVINFFLEDIGMLIIDWKGGGIVNILEKLFYFMGVIINLDGVGMVCVLVSIKVELNKR